MNISSITPRELEARLSADPRALLVDVRSPAEFAEVHAERAKNLPLPDATREGLAALGHSDAAPVYVICQSGKRAEVACGRLRAAGLDQAIMVAGGTEAWVAAGLPVVRGGGAIGLERQVRIGAGTLVLIGVVLSRVADPAFVWLAAFVGAGLVFAGATGFCGMGLLLAKAPWNR